MEVIEVERVSQGERRRWPRARVRLPLRVIDTEGDFRVLTGETVDLSVGGVLAALDGPLLGALEATVHLELPDGSVVLCDARVAGGGEVEGGAYRYRLAFSDLAADETDALGRVVAGAS